MPQRAKFPNLAYLHYFLTNGTLLFLLGNEKRNTLKGFLCVKRSVVMLMLWGCFASSSTGILACEGKDGFILLAYEQILELEGKNITLSIESHSNVKLVN